MAAALVAVPALAESPGTLEERVAALERRGGGEATPSSNWPLKISGNITATVQGSAKTRDTLESSPIDASIRADLVIESPVGERGLALLQLRGGAGNRGFYKDEAIWEIYYKYRFNDRLAVTPHIQRLTNRLGDSRLDDVTIYGTRMELDY